jgi:hypothetical protein
MKVANDAIAKGPRPAHLERRVSPARSLMRELIARVGRLPGMSVEATPVAWSIIVRKAPGFDFEVQVPRPGRKWHATARDAATGRAVWSHVSTYHRGLDESVEELATRVRHDIEWFLSRLAKATEVRCTTRITLQVFGWAVLRRSVMEWKISGAWRPVDAVLLKLD